MAFSKSSTFSSIFFHNENMKKIFFISEDGQSLVGTLVSVSIMGVAILGMASMFQYYNKEMRAVNEKLSALELEKSLITTLANGSVCAFELTQAGAWLPSGTTIPITFDSSSIGTANPPIINLNQVLINAAADAPVLASINSPAGLNSNSAVIKSIQITNITGPADGNTFSAQLQVTFDPDKLVRSLSPVSIHQTILTSGSGNTKTITGCLGESSSPTSAGAWQCGKSYCVRTTDGFACRRNVFIENNSDVYGFECTPPNQPDLLWPGSGPWWCIFKDESGATGASIQAQWAGFVCTRTTDGMLCAPDYYGRGWNCQSPAPNHPFPGTN